YYIGRQLNAERLERLFEGKFGRRLHLKKEDVRRAEGWFSRHGNKTVFFCRFIPLIRSLISLPAGAAKMKMRVFLLLTAAGTTIWNIVLVFLGKFAGDAWGTIVRYLDVYSLIAVGILAMLTIGAGVVFIKKRFLKAHGNAGKGQCGSK
ncbi:MAG TPA: DedA family protein, partial [Bacillota bacterium]|nr:DedA family protein [Bacillota bacterium]